MDFKQSLEQPKLNNNDRWLWLNLFSSRIVFVYDPCEFFKQYN